MEREREIAKLVNVLRRTARMAIQSEWTGGGSGQDSAKFCVDQYNRVLARLKELNPDMTTIFEPLPPESSLTVAAMACRQLAAFFEDEVGPGFGWGRGCAVGVDARSFKEFWNKSAQEIEDLGEFIRESVEEWARQRKGRRREQEKS
jgi:hypothetical protein